jgi:hypothetical protein
VLLVGPGAVGQVLGLGLRQAGVELAFYARPASAARLTDALDQGGLPLFQLSQRRRSNPIAHRLDGYQVVSDAAGSQEFTPDQIWFATPSPVYYSTWFREFVEAVPARRVACFAPEGGWLAAFPERDRPLLAGITFIAWQGDLAGGGGRPGAVNFWRPPLELPLAGSHDACAEVAELLAAAGFRPALKPPDYQKSLAATTAVLTTFAAGLELAGWSFQSYRRSPWLQVAAVAAREGAAAQLAPTGRATRLLLALLLSRPGLFLATFLLRPLFPFNLERYLRFHYRKTRDQTLDLLALFADDAERLGRPAGGLRHLQDNLLKNSRQSG